MRKSLILITLLLVISVYALIHSGIALAAGQAMSHVFGNGSTAKGTFELNAILKQGNTNGTISYSDIYGYSVNGKVTSITVSGNRADFKVDDSDAVIKLHNQVYPDTYVEGYVTEAGDTGDQFFISFCNRAGTSSTGTPLYLCMAYGGSHIITDGYITIKTK